MSYEHLTRICDKMQQEVTVSRVNKVVNDMDVAVAITGYVGSGKTTLAIQIGITVMRAVGKKFDLKRNVCYDSKTVIRKVIELQFEAIVIDEAIIAADAYDWAKKWNKLLDKVLTQARINHNIIIFCIPDMWRLQKGVRDRIRYWFECFIDEKTVVLNAKQVDVEIHKGFSILMYRHPNQRLRWNKEMYVKIFVSTDCSDLRKLERAFKKHYKAFFHRSLTFPILPKQLRAKYKVLERDNKLKFNYPDEDEGRKPPKVIVTLGILFSILNKIEGLTQKEIAKLVYKVAGDDGLRRVMVSYYIDKTEDEYNFESKVDILRNDIYKIKEKMKKSRKPLRE